MVRHTGLGEMNMVVQGKSVIGPEIEIRPSVIEDEPDIRELVGICFGNRLKQNYHRHLEGRYLLLFEDGKLAAMTGVKKTAYGGKDSLAIELTCTRPECRHKGYMQELFNWIIDVNGDRDIYCSCWRMGNNLKSQYRKDTDPSLAIANELPSTLITYGRTGVNLGSIMHLYGFEPVLEPREAFLYGHNCPFYPNGKQDCVMHTGDHCRCYEDLYLRKGRNK